MVLTSSLGELMVVKMLQYYKIVLNINDRAYINNIYIYIYTHTHTHIYIYIYVCVCYMVPSLTLDFMQPAIVGQSEGLKKTHSIVNIYGYIYITGFVVRRYFLFRLLGYEETSICCERRNEVGFFSYFQDLIK